MGFWTTSEAIFGGISTKRARSLSAVLVGWLVSGPGWPQSFLFGIADAVIGLTLILLMIYVEDQERARHGGSS